MSANFNVKRVNSYCSLDCLMMVFSKARNPPSCSIRIHGEPLKQVSSFVYLGSLLTQDGRCDKEVRRRIGIAKTSFVALGKVLTSRTVSLSLRLRMVKCYVWSTLLYGCETWTLSSVMRRRLAATEMWLIRRVMKIPWTQRRSNVEVLHMAGTAENLLENIKERQHRFLGYAMRKDEVEKLVTIGMIEGKRVRGRQRETFVSVLRDPPVVCLCPN